MNLTEEWENQWESFLPDETLNVTPEEKNEHFGILKERLKKNYPFHHPCYAGQMLKPPHPVAIEAYLSAMRINPNNHALDGGPATAQLEKECIIQLAEMFGFQNHLGHLTSSGTIANLEALWISRNIHPEKYIAFSEQAHYTHGRMCEVLRTGNIVLSTDRKGKIDLNDLEKKLKSFQVGTVVVTAGTTGTGSIDPVDEIVKLSSKYNFRIHVDAAYGGFYTVLKNNSLINGKDFKAISKADSVVIDPHKHGLQPYGCGCIIFADPSVGKFYKHDSPYTYFTSKDLHLGEISLECSRAGAAASAFWTTLRFFPLEGDKGFGKIFQKTRSAAIELSKKIAASENFTLLLEPELDIICYFPKVKNKKVSEISAKTEEIFNFLENHKTEPLFLAKLRVNKNIGTYNDELVWDNQTMTVLRSCLMKPEHLNYVETIFERLQKAFKECSL